MKAFKFITAALIAAPLLVSCSSSDSDDSAEGKDTLTFAAVPAESSQSLQNDYETLIKLIEKETGKKVEFQNASDYAAVIEGQRAGKIDITSYGPFSYVLAKDSGVPVEPIASPTNDESEDPSYTSLAYVKKDSDIKELKDLKGKKVCFVDPGSTSGYLVPMKGLMDAGIDMNSDLEPVMAGAHDSSLITLKDGGCDVAFAHDAMLKTLDKTGQVKESDLRSIWQSEPLTEDPITVNTDTVDTETADEITSAIREKANKPALIKEGICASEDDCVLPEEIEWGYKTVDDSDFDVIRDICKSTKADACEATA